MKHRIIQIDGVPWRIAREHAQKIVLIRADTLKEMRVRSGKTQVEAAALLGITQGQLARIESGKRSCTNEFLQAAEKLFREDSSALPPKAN